MKKDISNFWKFIITMLVFAVIIFGGAYIENRFASCYDNFPQTQFILYDTIDEKPIVEIICRGRLLRKNDGTTVVDCGGDRQHYFDTGRGLALVSSPYSKKFPSCNYYRVEWYTAND